MNQPNYRILWIDPGAVSGWATYSAFCISPIESGAPLFMDETWACGYLGPQAHYVEIGFLIESQSVQYYTVGVEEFVNTGNPAAKLISREYIGVAEYVVRDFNMRSAAQWKLVRQSPSQAKAFATDDKLEALGILNTPVSKKPNTDMNDAYRHLVYYLVNKVKMRHLVEKWKPNI